MLVSLSAGASKPQVPSYCITFFAAPLPQTTADQLGSGRSDVSSYRSTSYFLGNLNRQRLDWNTASGTYSASRRGYQFVWSRADSAPMLEVRQECIKCRSMDALRTRLECIRANLTCYARVKRESRPEAARRQEKGSYSTEYLCTHLPHGVVLYVYCT
jgi:hypothetical protein